MERNGFIHDMMDVKVLILFVTARSNYPLTVQEIYELCFQDDCLSYFDVCTAIPQMEETGHLEKTEDGRYKITDKGREAGEVVEDTLVYTVRKKTDDAVERFNRQQRRSNFVKTQVTSRDNGEYSVLLSLDDEVSNLMTVELVAPNQRQAVRLSRLFEKKAERLYKVTMDTLLDGEDEE